MSVTKQNHWLREYAYVNAEMLKLIACLGNVAYVDKER